MASESGFIVFLVAVLWILAIVIIEPKFFDRYAEIKTGIKKLAGGDTDSRITRTNDNTELDELAGDINDISEAVKNAVEKEVKNERMKSALISNVSHDLKTPLTSMVSYIDLLKKEGLDSENAPEYLRILDEKTNRLKDLTLDLFDAAKAASGDLPVDLQKIDLGSLVNQEVAEFQDVLEEKNIEIVINEQEPHIMAMADGRHLSRVLDNLLNNIKKYAMENSRAYIDITSDKTITVKNISRDKLNISADELMERFTRGDASRNTEGSGLGLAIARDLTNLMGGKFDIIIDGDLFKAEIKLHFPEE
jgi:signal transduction histidine kinase